ncbi:MAG: transglycosylase SLT domain-containing protein [Candidatus Rokuibacteriota bacterium]
MRLGLRLARIAVTLPICVGPVLGHAQILRVVDESGVVHYTNEPCHPRYARLAPEACPAPLGSHEVGPAPVPFPAPAGFTREIEAAAARHGVDARLVQAVVRVESGGDPGAISPKGAQGLMQLMPARAAALGVGDAFDPAANLDGGVRHLRELLTRYAGNVTLTLAAYNAGDEAVRLHRGIPPFRETQEYVRKVLALYSGDASPKTLPRLSPQRPRLQTQGPDRVEEPGARRRLLPVAR